MSKLTVRRIDSEKPDPTKDRRIADGLGLYLKVAKNGTKTFVYRFTYVAKRQELTLGTYPELTLADARGKRLEAAKVLETGHNPLHLVQIARDAKREALTVSELILDFHEHFLKIHYARPAEALQLLKANVGKEIGKLLIPDVTKQEMATTIGKIVKRGSKVTANRVLTLARRMFSYAVDRHNLEDNPVKLTRSGAGGREHSRRNNLQFEALGQVLEVLDDEDDDVAWQTRLALKLLIATAKRPGEIVTLEKHEVVLALWTNPKDKTKEKREDHLVFLSPFALAVIEEAVVRSGKSRWLFPSPRDEKRHIDRHSLSRAVLRLHAEGKLKPKFTPHDLRRTFASRAADIGIMPHVVEKILQHEMEGMMKVYNQASYLEERKAAMLIWGAKLEGLSKR